MSDAGRKYLDAALKTILLQGPVVKPLDGRLNVSVTLFPPTRARRDLDNHMKALLDAITKAGVWEDDSQIDALHIYRGEIVKHGKAEVMINGR